MDEQWISKLVEYTQEKERNGGFKRGELSKFFKELTKEFNIDNPNKIKNYYYRVIKSNQANETNLPVKKEAKSVKELFPYVNYPIYSTDVFSYIEKDEVSQEWFYFEEIKSLFDGKSLSSYLDTIEEASFLFEFIVENKTLKFISKEKLIELLKSFSVFTVHLNAANRSNTILSILQADEETLNLKRKEQAFLTLKIGEIYKVKIKKIMAYGAFVEIIDQPYLTGMIHISEIVNNYVSDVSIYLKEEQIVDAKLIQKNKDKKLAFSTKDLPFSNLMTDGAVSELTEGGLDSNVVNSIENSINCHKETDNLESMSSTMDKSSETKTIEPTPNLEDDTDLPPEWKEITEYIKSIVGPLSTDSKSKLKTLISNFGIFKFSIAMHDSSQTFKSDLGLILLTEVEKKLRDGL